MTNSTLSASKLAYEFENMRIDGADDISIRKTIEKDEGKEKLSESNLTYLEDFYDEKTGTSGTAFKDNASGEVILSYTGTNGITNVKDVMSDVEIITGSGNHYEPAYAFYEKIRDKYGDNITLTGHSLGGNIAQRVALEYNVMKTIVYNSAPLYIGENFKEAEGFDLIKEIINSPGFKASIRSPETIALYVATCVFLSLPEKEQKKISELEGNFTGQIFRIRAEDDILNDITDIVDVKHLGVEINIKDAGMHGINAFSYKEDEIQKLIDLGINVELSKDIDIDGDGKLDIEISKINITPKDLFSSKRTGVKTGGGKIQINPETLEVLGNNLIRTTLQNLEYIKAVAKKCDDKNNLIKTNFQERKQKVAEGIVEEFKNAGLPFLLDQVADSVGEIINKRNLLEYLSVEKTIDMGKINEKGVPYIGEYELNPLAYNLRLEELASRSSDLAESCSWDRTDSWNPFFKKPHITKSVEELERATQYLKEESEKTFEGEGLRTGLEDAISASLKTIFEVQQKNIVEIEMTLMNLIELIAGLATNFKAQDEWLGEYLKGSGYGVNYELKALPQNYQAYLERDSIFDDVKDVVQAFDRQVETNSRKYSQTVTRVYSEVMGNIKNNFEKWYELIERLEKATNSVEDTYEYNIDLEVTDEEIMLEDIFVTKERHYWGKLKRLYPEDVVQAIEEAKQSIISRKAGLRDTMELANRIKDNLGSIEDGLKRVIEKGVYKALELGEIVNSQKIIIRMIEKMSVEIDYVRSNIQSENMSGMAIDTLEGKLTAVKRELDYFGRMTGECFGDQDKYVENYKQIGNFRESI